MWLRVTLLLSNGNGNILEHHVVKWSNLVRPFDLESLCLSQNCLVVDKGH